MQRSWTSLESGHVSPYARRVRCDGGSAEEIINLGTSVKENNLPEQKDRQRVTSYTPTGVNLPEKEDRNVSHQCVSLTRIFTNNGTIV